MQMIRTGKYGAIDPRCEKYASGKMGELVREGGERVWVGMRIGWAFYTRGRRYCLILGGMRSRVAEVAVSETLHRLGLSLRKRNDACCSWTCLETSIRHVKGLACNKAMYQAQATKIVGDSSYQMIQGNTYHTDSLVWVEPCLPAVKEGEAVSDLS